MATMPILQFGTSRFLQAHADLFLSDALGRGEALGPVTVVQSSGDPARRARLQALADPAGFPVHIRGLVNGSPCEERHRVTSIRRALDSAKDWAEVCHVAAHEARVILSNTSEQGWVRQPADAGREFAQGMSYPAKLTQLLAARFRAGGETVQVMPTELVPRNGDTLRGRVMELAEHLSPGLANWIAAEVVFVNSLVDRIVSAPIEPAGAVAEPYALWAIEDCAGLVLPCIHPAVQRVGELAGVERRKLFILNLGHTWLVTRWKAEGGPPLVREWLADAASRAALEALYEEEVLPVFAAIGDADAPGYVQTTLDRFANPYLDHRLADIAQGHDEKLRRRIGGFLALVGESGIDLHQPRLRAALG